MLQALQQTKSSRWRAQVSCCALPQKPLPMQLRCAEVQLTQLFISLPQHNGETQDSLQYRKEVCEMVFKAGWSDTAHLDHSGSLPCTHSQTKDLTPNTILELPFGFKDLWIKKKPRINTKIKQTTEAQPVSIALPLTDLTESNTQEPNRLPLECNSSGSKPAFRHIHGSFMHCTRQNLPSVLLLELCWCAMY